MRQDTLLDGNTPTQYAVVVYWTVITLFGIGYGDLTPQVRRLVGLGWFRWVDILSSLPCLLPTHTLAVRTASRVVR